MKLYSFYIRNTFLVSTKTSATSTHHKIKLMLLTCHQTRNRLHQVTTSRITFTLKELTPWACSPLDLSDSGLSKQYAEEGKGLIEKFDLDPTKFEPFKNNIMEKGERCCMNSILTFEDNGIKLHLVSIFTRITKTMITSAVLERWSTPADPNASETVQNTLPRRMNQSQSPRHLLTPISHPCSQTPAL